MDFLKIVLDGYCDPNDRNFLTEYFVGEFKKAEKEFYTLDVFYEECKDVIKQLHDDIKQRKQNELIGVFNAIENAEKSGNTDELAELHEIKEQVENTYYMVPLYQFTNGRYNGHLGIDEIMYIEKALDISRRFAILEYEKKKLNRLKVKSHIRYRMKK